MAKMVESDDTERRGLARGLDNHAEAVKVTLGPPGRNVVLEKKMMARRLPRCWRNPS